MHKTTTTRNDIQLTTIVWTRTRWHFAKGLMDKDVEYVCLWLAPSVDHLEGLPPERCGSGFFCVLSLTDVRSKPLWCDWFAKARVLSPQTFPGYSPGERGACSRRLVEAGLAFCENGSVRRGSENLTVNAHSQSRNPRFLAQCSMSQLSAYLSISTTICDQKTWHTQ